MFTAKRAAGESPSGPLYVWSSMGAQQQMYDFVAGIIAIVTNSDGMWKIVGPFVLLGMVLFVVRWGRSSATGERMESLAQDYRETRESYDRAGRRIRRRP
jgi:hypothetical protein